MGEGGEFWPVVTMYNEPFLNAFVSFECKAIKVRFSSVFYL